MSPKLPIGVATTYRHGLSMSSLSILSRRLAVPLLAMLYATACQSALLLPIVRDTVREQDRGEIEQILYLAATEPAPFNHRHRMEAASWLQDRGQRELAHQLLAAMDPSQLEDEDFSVFTIQYARLLLALGKTQEALDFLHRDRVAQISPWQPHRERAEISMLRGYGRIANNQGMAALRNLSYAETLLSGQALVPLRQAIWELLIHSPRAQLQHALDSSLTTAEETTLRGWLELALLCRDYNSSPAQQVTRLNRWQRQWPGHPAGLSLPPAAQLLSAPPQQFQQIALFLPLSGKLAEIGAAVQNGILAAWYADRGEHVAVPILQVIDTGLEEDLPATYQRVVEEGAELVIGPLDRDRIRAILDQDELPIPVLALKPNQCRRGTDTGQQLPIWIEPQQRAAANHRHSQC